MKISIAASILILLVSALFGVPNHQRLVTLRESHAKLVAAAAQFGVSIDPDHPDDPVRVTKREREDKEADAKAAAAEFIAFAREMEALQKNGKTPDEAQQKRSMEMMERMASLDTTQLKIVIAEIRAANDLGDEIRQGLIGWSILTLAGDQPQTALALLTESADLFKSKGKGSHVVSSSLAAWAKDDALAAVDWAKQNSAKFPDLITDGAKCGMIFGMAAQDPRLAFKLIGDLGIKEISHAISGIVMVTKTPEQRTASLNALREHLATLPDAKTRTELSENAVRGFAHDIGEGEFEAGTRWIADSNFSPLELESFVSGLHGSIKSGDTGKWIEWVGEKLPPDKADENIESLVSRWTSNDYKAAGEWLVSAPAGPVKNAAIQSYARTVSEYEPATAAQWAVTLPPGKDRDQTLKTIYHNWPKDAAAAREAFKQEHGIK